MRYKPLRGHHLVTFILLQTRDQVVATIQQDIPQHQWNRLRIWRHDQQYWIQLDPPVRLNCQTLNGIAFIAQGHHHQAAERLETDLFIGGDSCLVWLAFGQRQVVQIRHLEAIAVHQFLQIPEPQTLSTWTPPTLQEVPSHIIDQANTARDPQGVLALETYRVNPESKAFLQAIKDGQPMPRSRRSLLSQMRQGKREADGSKSQPSLWQQLSTILGRLFTLLPVAPLSLPKSQATSFGTGSRVSSPVPSQTRGLNRVASFLRRLTRNVRGQQAPDQATATSRQSINAPFHRLARYIRDYWRQRVMRSQLGAILGKRQAQYFQKMMQQFEQGNWSEALKMAVPLSDYRAAIEQRSSPLLGLPKKRQTLAISRKVTNSSASFNFGESSYQYMRAIYEKSYQQLKTQGRPKEAAFVLAELLNRVSEAVDYLVAEGFFEEAAEIAEGRLSKPEKAIKLWIQAGKTQRAITLAIRSNRFQAALLLLQGTEHYSWLESLWLERLIRSGDFETIFHHILGQHHPDEKLKTFFQDSLPTAYLDDPAWLARGSFWLPWSSLDTRLEELFADPCDPQFSEFLNHFTLLLIQQSSWMTSLKSNLSQDLLKELYRQILTYRGRPLTLDQHALGLIHSLIDDRLMVHCRPQHFTNPYIQSPAIEQQQTHFSFSPSAPLITDIGLTPDGRFGVAMGELGVRIYNARFRLLHHLQSPAHGLVSAAKGGVLLAVEHREKLHRVHRIQLYDLQTAFLGQQPILTYGRYHNGCTWPVALTANRVSLIDVDAADWKRVWSVGNLEGKVTTVVSNDSQMTFVVAQPERIDIWQYQLPQLRLVSRSGLGTIQAEKALEGLILGQDGQVYGQYQSFDAQQQRNGTQFYRSESLRTFQALGPLDGNINAATLLFADSQTLIVSVALNSQTQRVKVFEASRSELSLLFNLNCPIGKLILQSTPTVLAVGQNDQLLLYNRVKKCSHLLRIA